MASFGECMIELNVDTSALVRKLEELKQQYEEEILEYYRFQSMMEEYTILYGNQPRKGTSMDDRIYLVDGSNVTKQNFYASINYWAMMGYEFDLTTDDNRYSAQVNTERMMKNEFPKFQSFLNSVPVLSSGYTYYSDGTISSRYEQSTDVDNEDETDDDWELDLSDAVHVGSVMGFPLYVSNNIPDNAIVVGPTTGEKLLSPQKPVIEWKIDPITPLKGKERDTSWDTCGYIAYDTQDGDVWARIGLEYRKDMARFEGQIDSRYNLCKHRLIPQGVILYEEKTVNLAYGENLNLVNVLDVYARQGYTLSPCMTPSIIRELDIYAHVEKDDRGGYLIPKSFTDEIQKSIQQHITKTEYTFGGASVQQEVYPTAKIELGDTIYIEGVFTLEAWSKKVREIQARELALAEDDIWMGINPTIVPSAQSKIPDDPELFKTKPEFKGGVPVGKWAEFKYKGHVNTGEVTDREEGFHKIRSYDIGPLPVRVADDQVIGEVEQ